MNRVDVTLLVFVLTLGIALAARRLRTPMPVVLAAAGIALGMMWRLVSWLPPVSVPPDRVLFVFLPPLLTTAAYSLPLSAFRRNLRPITLLAVGLVLATMGTAAVVAHALGGMTWAAAFVLGAIIAPPDPVAATSVAGRTGLSHRLVVILEGEGLLNDAVAITAYGLAVTAAVSNEFAWGEAGLALLRAAPTGVAIGFAVGWAFTELRRHIDDVTIEAGMSILMPYVTYQAADRLGASAVLAVVTLGFVLQRRATQIATPAARLATRTVWSAFQFASTALVFLLVGLLIGELVDTELSGHLLGTAAAVTLVVIGFRFAWLFVVPRALRRVRAIAWAEPPTWRELVVLGWAGMRGVVSLSLALALPSLTGADGSSPRGAIIVVTLVVIIATLIAQGLTLVPLIERLGVADADRDDRDERRTRARARRAGLAALERKVRVGDVAGARADQLCDELGDGRLGVAKRPVVYRRESASLMAVLEAERRVVVEMRSAGRIGGALAERLVTEIDTDMLRVRGEVGRLTAADEA